MSTIANASPGGNGGGGGDPTEWVKVLALVALLTGALTTVGGVTSLRTTIAPADTVSVDVVRFPSEPDSVLVHVTNFPVSVDAQQAVSLSSYPCRMTSVYARYVNSRFYLAPASVHPFDEPFDTNHPIDTVNIVGQWGVYNTLRSMLVLRFGSATSVPIKPVFEAGGRTFTEHPFDPPQVHGVPCAIESERYDIPTDTVPGTHRFLDAAYQDSVTFHVWRIG